MTAAVGHHQIVYAGGAQALRVVPLDRHARATAVTAATYRIVDLRLSEEDPLRVISSGAATLDTTTTTTTAACGLGTANARKLPLTSTLGFEQGRYYLVTAADGARELVLCEAAGTGYITPRNELARRYDAGVTVRGIEVSCTFPSLEAAKEESLQDGGGPYAVDWSWDLDPSPRREFAWIVRQADALTITEEELLGLDASLAPTTGARVSLTNAIRQAAIEIRAQCQAVQVDPDNFGGGTTMRLAVMYRAAWHVVKMLSGDANGERATLYRQEAEKYLQNALMGRSPEKSVSVSPSTDTAPGTDKTYKHWQRIT
ncbi:MAG: hypothetical protein JNL82_29850 [Myxococcales bacterium]|nr:hypothetical protein [Myxococcales bacterium]